MGAWGTGNFENDDAMDYLPRLLGEDGAAVALTTLRAVDRLNADADIDAPVACQALVAAELVAAHLGRPSGALPDELRAVPRASLPPDDVALAIRVVERIATGSELSSLWEDEAESFDEWASVLDDLLRRLGARGL